MKSDKYQPRFYRQWPETKDLVSFQVQVSDSDLLIRTLSDLTPLAEQSLLSCRNQIEDYIRMHPEFRTSLVPYAVESLAPAVVRAMAEAAAKAGVGPMAAVAGAVAEFVGRELLAESAEVIVENGGDIFLAGQKKRRVGLYAGRELPTIFIEIAPGEMPCGVCTSSGTLGHSLSFGRADSVTILSPSAALADAAATAVGNLVQSAADIERGLERGLSIDGVTGVMITVDGHIGMQGGIRLCE